MPEYQLLPFTHTNSRSASSAYVVRQKFTDYFSTVGSVPWQADSVSRGKYWTSIKSNCQSCAPQVFFTLFAFWINWGTMQNSDATWPPAQQPSATALFPWESGMTSRKWHSSDPQFNTHPVPAHFWRQWVLWSGVSIHYSVFLVESWWIV